MLHWRAMPMCAAKGTQRPHLGAGVYMHVVETTGGTPKPHYVGKSTNLGRRWREHVLDWYLYPHEEYAIPETAEDYLADPVDAINSGRLAQCLPNRGETMRAILERTWFCWAEVDNGLLADIEYVLQEGTKLHWGITAEGWIGDASNRRKPRTALVIENHLVGPLLQGILPLTLAFRPTAGVEVG